MAEPWYHEGLRFSCRQCGACCIGDPGVVWVNAEEVTALAEFLHLSRAEVIKRYTRRVLFRRSLIERWNGDCVFYDRKGGCEVYRVRPPQCRSWPFWPSNLRSPETWREACEMCPGAGHGELHDLENIASNHCLIRI